MIYNIRNLKQTKEFASRLISSLDGGDVIGLIGNLGTGKTTLTQQMAKFLGVKNHITSPTFVLMKIYKTNHKTIKTLCHIDAYRLKNENDLLNIGADEYINSHSCLTIIEWANNVKNILPLKTKYITLTQNNDERIFET